MVTIEVPPLASTIQTLPFVLDFSSDRGELVDAGLGGLAVAYVADRRGDRAAERRFLLGWIGPPLVEPPKTGRTREDLATLPFPVP